MGVSLLDLPQELLIQVGALQDIILIVDIDTTSQILSYLDRSDVGSFRLLDRSCAKLALPGLYHQIVVTYDQRGMRLLNHTKETGHLKYIRELSFTAPVEFLPRGVLPEAGNSRWRYVDEYHHVTYSHLQPLTAVMRNAIGDVLRLTRLRALTIHYPCFCRRVERSDDMQQLRSHAVAMRFDRLWAYFLAKACLDQLQHLELDQPETTKLTPCRHDDEICLWADSSIGLCCVASQLFRGLKSLSLRLRWDTESRQQDPSYLPYELIYASTDIHTLTLSYREDNGLDLKMLDETRMYRYDHYHRLTAPLDANIIPRKLETLTLHGLTVPESQLIALFSKLRDSLKSVRVFYSRLTEGYWRNIFRVLLTCEGLREWQAIGLEMCSRAAKPSGDYRTYLKGALQSVRLRELEMHLSSQTTECWYAYGDFLREINRRRASQGLRVHKVPRHRATSPPIRWPNVPYDPGLIWLPYPHLSMKSMSAGLHHQSLDYIFAGKVRFRGLYSYAELEAQGYLQESFS